MIRHEKTNVSKQVGAKVTLRIILEGNGHKLYNSNLSVFWFFHLLVFYSVVSIIFLFPYAKLQNS